jgi:hypothetical protein
MVLSFGLASLVDVIPRLVLWDIPGIRSSVSSRSVLEQVSGNLVTCTDVSEDPASSIIRVDLFRRNRIL